MKCKGGFFCILPNGTAVVSKMEITEKMTVAKIATVI